MNILKHIRHSFKKEGGYGLLNIAGLSIGMAMSLLIIWYLQYHLSFNAHIPEKEKIYRVVQKDRNDASLSFGNPLPLAHAIRNDYPGFGEIAALSSYSYPVICGETKFNIKASVADANIFKVLGTKLLVGSEKVLSEPGSSVLTQSCAQKLFGQEESIGKTFTIESYGGKKIFTVKGLIKNPPANSDFDSEIYLSWESMNQPDWQKLWWWGGYDILAKVKNTIQKEDLEQKINTILERHNAPYINGRYDFQLIPLKGSHFRTDIGNYLTTPVSSSLIWVLGIIAAFIIVIACINFVNLSISQSERNVKETGIHKVLGASRKSLIADFLMSTFFKTIIAMMISLVLTKLFILPFQKLTQINDYDLFSNPSVWAVLLGIVLISGLLSGLYPALALSRPKPVELLSNKKAHSSSGNIFRKSLVIAQLSMATMLIIASLFIFKQISFMKNHDLGFNKNGLIAVQISSLNGETNNIREKASILEQEISKRGVQNGITDIASIEALPGALYKNNFTITNPENLNTYSVVSVGIDENYADVLEVPVVEGRNFSKELASDEGAVLINETFKKKLGWSSIADKQLAVISADDKTPVIGVIKDVNINSLAQAIPPMIYRYKKNAYPEYMVFRVAPGHEATALKIIKNEWEQISEGKPFESFNVANKFESMYGSEERLSKIIAAFCMVAVLLSCFGLFSYIAFSVQRRTKEIGIRKVNGAKITEVMTMLNSDFIKWVIVSFVIATPVTFYATTRWLESFAYKTSLSWWIFASAGLLALGIAMLTVSWQSWRAATRNPVEALRYE
ncbi:FtsX-like permease family protein [Maribellus comscasis]|uniref:FtsX-like permease family protein n=1 Tax=Maribellus comscasis TaxID=2681766 RepID=A0A6I6JQG3_9BACT|nr:ABC transporter permease [Maribellus comscasis]QGY44661.1 FtsX-like permease family protein [Maribellus comscasis]